jgi:hypothetical protein
MGGIKKNPDQGGPGLDTQNLLETSKTGNMSATELEAGSKSTIPTARERVCHQIVKEKPRRSGASMR